ncbi:MAG: hypothetical protein QOH48_1930 [Actinomycetota bacterium]|nr:hypothetical protein [Actinomycetota bacterium]
MRVSPKVLSWAAPLIALAVIGGAMFAISNITGLHLSVEKKTIQNARLSGTYELFSTVQHVNLPHGAGSKGLDVGAIRRFFQVGQQLSCRCVMRFQPSCSSGPCGGKLSVWRAGQWSSKVPFAYEGGGRYSWRNPPDRCGCYGGGGIRATMQSRIEAKVAASNQVGGHSDVFEFQGSENAKWRLKSRRPHWPARWRVVAAVDAAPTQF